MYSSIDDLALGPDGAGAVFLVRTSGQTEVTCDRGKTWHTVVAGMSGFLSAMADRVLVAMRSDEGVVWILGTDDEPTQGNESGGFRAVIH